jgi:hypothetical protein
MGFEPTIPVFERAKTVHALDRVATVIGHVWYNFLDLNSEVLDSNLEQNTSHSG